MCVPVTASRLRLLYAFRVGACIVAASLGAALVAAACAADLGLDAHARLGLLSDSVAFSLIGWCLWAYRMCRRSRVWPTANGTVLSNVAKVDEGATLIRLVYEFDARGSVYRGSRVRFGAGPFYRQRSIAELSERYRTGARVSVHYDPAVPDHCTLESDFRWVDCAPQLLFALAILLGRAFQLGLGQ